MTCGANTVDNAVYVRSMGTLLGNSVLKCNYLDSEGHRRLGQWLRPFRELAVSVIHTFRTHWISVLIELH